MKKKNILIAALMALFVFCMAGCGSKEKLKIYLPGEYMSDDLIPNFEKKYNVKVDVELFDSNEMMYTKVMAGGKYDVLIPSDYMIERLIKEDYLQKLDTSKLTNYSKLVSDIKKAPYNGYDPEAAYSVPYFWGTVGIVYNSETVPSAEVEEKGFGIMKDTKYASKIYMYDSERDSFMIAFKDLGYSMNTSDESEIMAAYDWLVELNTTMDPTTVTDEVIDGMAQGRKDLAIVYSGDAAYILSENEKMRYYTPSYGTNVWVDAMVIPKNAANVDLAYKFIDYVISYDAAMSNTEAVGYASVNSDVLAEVTKEGGMYDGNEAYIPRTGYDKDEVFTDNEFLRKKLSELWIKVKASQ